jgi:hydroxymethylpyrimidine/phosphomethylpyrimidine kinase
MMRKQLPIVLTIAGSDSGGGAGIQADLKTFAALGVHGTSAITCITAQNPERVLGIEACSPAIVRQQIEAVFEELAPAAVKTGMLYSEEIIKRVAGFFKKQKTVLVVDPVIISTSGKRLLKPSAMRALQEQLLPLASLVTPNLDEAKVLLGREVSDIEGMRAAARELHKRFGGAWLMKGGHLKGAKEAADIFYDGKAEMLLTSRFVKGVSTHGTGCTYSAAITACLALGMPMSKAVEGGKNYITESIAKSDRVGKHFVLNTVWGRAGIH